MPMVPLNNKKDSMEFRGIRSAPISITRAVPGNFIEFLGIWSVPISMSRAIPWSSMGFHGTYSAPVSMTEIGVRQFRWHEQFHGIPWNLWCAKFADTSSSMEFHGTASAPISLTRAVPWNSMELEVHQFRRKEEFHGIRWNLKCDNFDDTSSSMDFHGTSLVIKYIKIEVAWSLVEFEACMIPSEID